MSSSRSLRTAAGLGSADVSRLLAHRLLSGAFVAAFVVGSGALGCADDDPSIPVRVAPPSRHSALRDSLADGSSAFAFRDGDWLEDLGDAPFYAVGWLAHRGVEGNLDADARARRDAAVARARVAFGQSMLDGDIQDKVMAALGIIELVAATGDRSEVPALDAFLDRLDKLTSTFGDYLEAPADQSWAIRTYGPTAVTALVALVEAQYALFVGGPKAGERKDRALAIDARIRERALGDLVDASTGRSARGYAFAPGQLALSDYPNIAMLLLKARLFRLTKTEDFRLEARAIFAALQPLKLSDAPARYSSPYARTSIKDTRDLSTLSSQNYLTLGLLLLFEITGDQRFVDEADRMLDGIEKMRGPWCESMVHTGPACAPTCVTGQACVEGACIADHCTEGLLHHTVDGRLALPEDGTVFCAGCNWQTLYVIGYRRALAGEKY